MADAGLVPHEAARDLRQKGAFDIQRIEEERSVTIALSPPDNVPLEQVQGEVAGVIASLRGEAPAEDQIARDAPRPLIEKLKPQLKTVKAYVPLTEGGYEKLLAAESACQPWLQRRAKEITRGVLLAAGLNLCSSLVLPSVMALVAACADTVTVASVWS